MNMEDTSLWTHQTLWSCETGGGRLLSVAVSGSVAEQGSHGGKWVFTSQPWALGPGGAEVLLPTQEPVEAALP